MHHDQTRPPLGLSSAVPSVGVFVSCAMDAQGFQPFGWWVDLTPNGIQTMEELQQAFAWLALKWGRPVAEIGDTEGVPSHFIGSNRWAELLTYVNGISECAHLLEDEAFQRWAEFRAGEPCTHEAFRSEYVGSYSSCSDAAESYARRLGPSLADGADEWPFNCIDWEKAWHLHAEQEGLAGEYTDHGFHVFRYA